MFFLLLVSFAQGERSFSFGINDGYYMPSLGVVNMDIDATNTTLGTNLAHLGGSNIFGFALRTPINPTLIWLLKGSIYNNVVQGVYYADPVWVKFSDGVRIIPIELLIILPINLYSTKNEKLDLTIGFGGVFCHGKLEARSWNSSIELITVAEGIDFDRAGLIGLEYYPSKNLSIFANVEYLFGKINRIKIKRDDTGVFSIGQELQYFDTDSWWKPFPIEYNGLKIYLGIMYNIKN